MKVRVLLFARLREMSGVDRMEMEVPEGATLGDVWRELQAIAPPLGRLPRPPLTARNLEYAGPDTRLSGDDEIAFLPPVSGG